MLAAHKFDPRADGNWVAHKLDAIGRSAAPEFDNQAAGKDLTGGEWVASTWTSSEIEFDGLLDNVQEKLETELEHFNGSSTGSRDTTLR